MKRILALGIAVAGLATCDPETARPKLYIEPVSVAVLKATTFFGDLTHAFLVRKDCLITVSVNPVADYLLKYEGGLDWVLYRNGDAVGAFKTRPLMARKVAEKVCELIKPQ